MPGMAGTAGRAPVAMMILPAGTRVPSTCDAAVNEARRPFAIGDAVVGGQKVDVLGLAQLGNQRVLLANGSAPIGQFGLGRDAGEARRGPGVVERLGGADQRLRRARSRY